MTPVRLLLINPAAGSSFWGLEYALDLLGRSYSNAPLPLLTVAALTPLEWRVRLVDENVEPVDLDEPCDVVGITAMNVQAARAFALADAFRRRGRTVALGGPLATLEPERCAPHADVLFVGEAERTWPRFCRDFSRQDHRSRYQETEPVDLAQSPVPRYDLLRRAAYASLSVQASRGCPFSCDFCDIVVMQGRRVSTKPPDRVLAEVEAVRRVGGDSIFFTDDNFMGSPRNALALVTALAAHRRATGFAPRYFTQASLDLAEQPALLARMVEAGFTRVFLGIETPRQDSLREVGKRQNLRGDLLGRVATIQRAGLMIWAGMIVGFDHDDPSVFEEQARFLDEAGIAVAMVGMLNAPPRTALWVRLVAEGRLDPDADWTDNCSFTNVIPRGMSRAELFSGFAGLVRQLYAPENYARRVLRNVERMDPACGGGARFPSAADLRAMGRATRTFVFSRDGARRRHFLPNLLRSAWRNPSRVVEAAIHLGLWRHFEVYVPELAAGLQRAEQVERVRDRVRAWASPPAPLGAPATPATAPRGAG